MYYHNYMLGELFAAQLRAQLRRLSGHPEPSFDLDYSGRRDFGKVLTDKVFRPGMREPWPQFVKSATGQALSPQYFAAELR